MNAVQSFLGQNRALLSARGVDIPESPCVIVVAPRFRTSSHIVCLILSESGASPLLVAKLPRLAGDNAALKREASNLREVQGRRAAGFSSIPRLVAYEPHGDRRLLLESGLGGGKMKPAFVRAHTVDCIEVVLDWLIDLQEKTAGAPIKLQPLAQGLLRQFRRFPVSNGEKASVRRTVELISPLQYLDVPSVFEHGDLSSPNLLITPRGDLGVVDWELATPNGLPAVDLFFFLTYVAFALEKPRKPADYMAAFEKAFFGPAAWARSYIARYAGRLGFSRKALKPLFVLCWSRYVGNILLRLRNSHRTGDPIGDGTAAWLRGNRYYALWRYTVLHSEGLNL